MPRRHRGRGFRPGHQGGKGGKTWESLRVRFGLSPFTGKPGSCQGQLLNGPGKMDISQHPRIANPNPLAKLLEAGADAKTVVPDSAIIVRGGQAYTHQPGSILSAQMGSSATEAAAGLPHGTVRITTAGAIRAAGGTVELAPEAVYPGGPLNTWHVNITEGVSPAFPAHGSPNPVPKAQRLIP
jgi:hypothetical protein